VPGERGPRQLRETVARSKNWRWNFFFFLVAAVVIVIEVVVFFVIGSGVVVFVVVVVTVVVVVFVVVVVAIVILFVVVVGIGVVPVVDAGGVGVKAKIRMVVKGRINWRLNKISICFCSQGMNLETEKQ